MLVATYKSSQRHTQEHCSFKHGYLSDIVGGRNTSIRQRKEYISYLQIIENPGFQLVSRATV